MIGGSGSTKLNHTSKNILQKSPVYKNRDNSRGPRYEAHVSNVPTLTTVLITCGKLVSNYTVGLKQHPEQTMTVSSVTIRVQHFSVNLPWCNRERLWTWPRQPGNFLLPFIYFHLLRSFMWVVRSTQAWMPSIFIWETVHAVSSDYLLKY